jgi:hypothetical protein
MIESTKPRRGVKRKGRTQENVMKIFGDVSSEKQMAVIGRLVTERSEADRRIAVIRNEFEPYQGKLNELALHLEYLGDPARITKAISVLDALIGAGGLDHLKKLVSEYQSLTTRVADIGQTLKKARAD